MNGDLSLSQSLGGLRIANPDDDVRTALSSSTSSPPPSSSNGRYNRPAPREAELPLVSPIDDGKPDPLDALGYNPSSYSTTPLQPGTPVADHSRDGSGSQKLHHRQSMPIAHRAQQQPYYASNGPDRAYNQGYTRPASGFFDQGPLSSSAQSQPSDLAYARARGDSNPSARPPVQRSLSKAGAAAAMQAASSRGPPPANWGRQMSNPGPSSGAYPPRRSSRPGQESPYTTSAATSPGPSLSSNPLAQGSLPGNSEDWKDKGAAVGVQKSVDKNGKPVSRVVKKGVKDFQFGKTLGEGSYSTVLAAQDRQTGRSYAIKVLDKRHIIKEKKVKYVNIEKDTLNRLTDHPGVVRLYYTFQDERSLYFVLDLASGGELLGVLKKYSSFDEECSRFYGAQILDAIEYMHLRGIIHRDLKPENVLLDDQGHVKITDFGTAKILDIGAQSSQFGQVSVNNDPMDGADTDRAVSFVGTAEYVSPELLTDKNACKASDLWAFGCIIYQLLAGRPPFKARSEYLTFQKIVKLDYTFPEGFPAVAKDLVERLLVLNPSERLPISGIKEHPFFSGISWGKGLWKVKPPKLKPYNPNSRETPTSASAAYESSQQQPNPYAKPQSRPGPSNSVSASKPPKVSSSSRPQHRVITEIQPPTQLDIDWSPVLTKTNERVLKIGELNVFTASTPGSPTTRTGSHEMGTESSSKFSRFFSAATTKKRQRLVILSSRSRLILAPTGGDRKEAKVIIDLTGPDVSWKAYQDAKGYTVWCVYTRDKQLTFEDPKANTGDPGSSVRSSQEWIDTFEELTRDSTSALPSPYTPESMYAAARSGAADADDAYAQESMGGQILRNTLRKEPGADSESLKKGKRFSKRHSKNGLAAVF